MIDIMRQDGRFTPPTLFTHTIDLVQGSIGMGVTMGEGWLLTAETCSRQPDNILSEKRSQVGNPLHAAGEMPVEALFRGTQKQQRPVRQTHCRKQTLPHLAEHIAEIARDHDQNGTSTTPADTAS